jgi:integrase
MLPQTLKAPLLEHLKRAKSMHDHDLADGRGRVLLPDAIDRKYPSAPGEWRWQWVFPQENRWKNEKTSEEGRHHVHESIIQKAVNSAVRKAGLAKRATCHTFRHSFATQLLEKWIRHQDGAGTSRPQGRENHHDLYPRPQPGRQGCQESRGRFVEEKRRCVIQKPYIPPRTVQKTAC